MPKLSPRSPVGPHGGYGWVRDLPDQRDHLFSAPMEAITKLATTPHFDLTSASQMPPVWDQGQLGSCQPHASGGCFSFAHRKSGHLKFNPSKLWLYYQARLLEGSVGEDAGSSIRDGFKVLAKVGACPDADWPYHIETFTNKPTAKMAKDALLHKSLSYRSVVQSLTTIKSALLAGYPVAFGFTVYDSFESQQVADTGVVPMPGYHESMLGGHAVMAVGYDDPSQRFIVRNSWGTGWGLDGYCTMPYAYLMSNQLSSDFWTVSIAT